MKSKIAFEQPENLRISRVKGTDTSTAIVIGAGVGGMAAAIRLALKGYRVQVFEQQKEVGGKMGEIKEAGFRFDSGPSLFTLPELVDELFELAGKDPREYFSYKKLETTCKYFYPDGTMIEGFSDPAEFAREIERKTTDEASSVLRFLKKSKLIYEITENIFLKKSLHRVSTFLSVNSLKAFVKLPALGIHRTMAKANSRAFKDPRTLQLFNRYATYNGSDPYQAPSTLNVIPHLEHNLGAWFAEGGMFQVAKALKALADELGVIFHFEKGVERILIKDKRATGVQMEGEIKLADIVVSNMDVVNTYRKLMPEQKAPKTILNQPKSSSALIFYWGMERKTPELDTHNILFSGAYRKEFDYLFKKKDILDDPTVYLYLSSRQCEADAPEGGENWFTMINAPHIEGQDWDELVKRARTDILRKIEKTLGFDPEPFIRFEKVLDPRGIRDGTSSFKGALYGNSSNNVYSAFLRHPNFVSNIRGLSFVGGSVHPGGGIPLCMLSAKIAIDQIK